jgi:hypothetical protein
MAHCFASYALARAEKRRDASKQSGGFIWYDSILHPLSTCFHEASFQCKQRLVSRAKLNVVSTFLRTRSERMEMRRREHRRRKQAVDRFDTFSSGASLQPGKRRYLRPLPFRVNKRNDALCHLRTITHDGKTFIDGSETFPEIRRKRIGISTREPS